MCFGYCEPSRLKTLLDSSRCCWLQTKLDTFAKSAVTQLDQLFGIRTGRGIELAIGSGRGAGYRGSMSALQALVSEVEYLASDETSRERSEYVDGYVRSISGGTIDHSRLAQQVNVALWNATEGTSCRVHTHDVKLRISAGARLRYYYPDVMVACEPSDDNRWEERPCLIVEVLSPSTARFDAVEKLTVYCTIDSLKAYVIVDGEGQRLAVHRRVGETWRVESYERGEELELDCPKIKVLADHWLPSVSHIVEL
jgi:Uma2 family endonuclease